MNAAVGVPSNNPRRNTAKRKMDLTRQAFFTKPKLSWVAAYLWEVPGKYRWLADDENGLSVLSFELLIPSKV